jgi:septum formation inhibitor-activating ATPase MinD
MRSASMSLTDKTTASISVQPSEDAACVWIIDNQLGRRNLSLYAQGELRIARGKFSQLKEQAKENQAAYSGNQYEVGLFVNSQKVQTPVNTTKELATELKTSEQTASRIIQIQAKADEPTKEKFINNL